MRACAIINRSYFCVLLTIVYDRSIKRQWAHAEGMQECTDPSDACILYRLKQSATSILIHAQKPLLYGRKHARTKHTHSHRHTLDKAFHMPQKPCASEAQNRASLALLSSTLTRGSSIVAACIVQMSSTTQNLCPPARCVSHKLKANILLVYQKGNVDFHCGFFSHKALSSISRTFVVFCNLSLWEKRLANYSNFVQAYKT